MLQAVRNALICLLLALAPMELLSVHGPVSDAHALGEAVAEHVHSHAGGLAGLAHDVIDHDHSVAILPGRADATPLTISDLLLLDKPQLPGSLARDGPRRPPRDVTI
jgi:hypothetical protein